MALLFGLTADQNRFQAGQLLVPGERFRVPGQVQQFVDPVDLGAFVALEKD
jgi:hypothetical protein